MAQGDVTSMSTTDDIRHEQDQLVRLHRRFEIRLIGIAAAAIVALSAIVFAPAASANTGEFDFFPRLVKTAKLSAGSKATISGPGHLAARRTLSVTASIDGREQSRLYRVDGERACVGAIKTRDLVVVIDNCGRRLAATATCGSGTHMVELEWVFWPNQRVGRASVIGAGMASR
jgi:hypothetical protein